MRKKVGAVRCDLEFKEDIGIKEGFHRNSNRGVLGKDEQAVLAFRETDFLGGGEHAFRFDLAHDGFTDGEIFSQLCAGKAAGNLVANLVVGGAAYDLAESFFTAIDLRDFESIRVRVLNRFLDLGDNNFLGRNAFGDDAFNLDASEGEEVGNLGDGFSGEVEVCGEPVKGDVHDGLEKKRFTAEAQSPERDAERKLRKFGYNGF